MPEFKHGYIFGDKIRHLPLRTIAGSLKEARELDLHSKLGVGFLRTRWKHWSTSLSSYFHQPREHPSYRYAPFNYFEGYLEEQLKRAANEGRKLRVLDVGVGSAFQWKNYVENPNLELHVTSLTETLDPVVASKLKPTICRTDQLHKKFQPGYFDLIISSNGVHNQELSFIENAVHLLKPGGEAFLLALENSFLHEELEKPKFYEIKQFEPIHTEDGNTGFKLHLKKN